MKKQRHYFANRSPTSKSYGFSSSHVWMWELDHKESWALENWCFWTVVLEKTLESPLDCKEIKSVNHKGNQSWIFIWRIDAEVEASILWSPGAKNWLNGKDPYAVKTGEGDDRGWDGWTSSLTWVWASTGIWWWTGKPFVLQSLGSQRVEQEWVNDLKWTGSEYLAEEHKPCIQEADRLRATSAMKHQPPHSQVNQLSFLKLSHLLPSHHTLWLSSPPASLAALHLCEQRNHFFFF